MARTASILSAFLLALAARAEAQVDESLLTRRWKTENFYAETFDKPLVTSRGRLEESDESVQIFHWNSEGRIKFDRKDLEPPAWIGYRALTVGVNSGDERYDHQFADVALAAAVRLGSVDDWAALASAGIGTANDGRWDNPHALYPAATLDFTLVSPPTTVWHAGLTLDGNRSLVPLVPLPLALLETSPDPSMNVVVGFPRSEVLVRPFNPVTVSLRWKFPDNGQARLEADVGSGFSLFVEAARRVDGFHLRHEDRVRQFLVMHTAEAGIRWVTTGMDVSLSAGYAFGQRFFSGPDIVHRSRGTSIDDLPFIAITLPSKFWAVPF